MRAILYNILLIIGFILVSCNKPVPSAPNDGDSLPDITKMEVGGDWEIPFSGEFLLPYSGIKEGDEIKLTLRSDQAKTYIMRCTAVDTDKGAYFSVPEQFIGGMCSVYFPSRSTFLTQETFINVNDTTGVQKKSGMTVYGRVIDYNGNPIPGVLVSDGVRTSKTDERGCYWIASMRKYGYVFISIPSGYKVAVNRTVPQFFSHFKSKRTSDYEVHNFILEPEDNQRHRTIVFTDTHLARRTDDLNQFEQYFKSDLRAQIAQAKSEGIALCALALGDLAWDEWWYKNNYSLVEYFKTMSDLDMPVFSIPGNHDNDPYVADDFLSEESFRKNLGPTYYSFNIGNVHYIMMDNTIFRNEGGAPGVVGNVQDYSEGFTADQMRWLKDDLKEVAEGTTIIFGLHIPFTRRPKPQSDGSFQFSYLMPAEFRVELQEILEPYNVHIVSGHTHINYTNKINEKLIEHNTGAVCGTWWWTGYYSGNKCRINGDGSPSGYKIFEIGKDMPSSLSWSYKAMSRDSEYQFRAYDLNNCLINRNLYCPADKNPKVSDALFKQYACGYDVTRYDNKILVNVFNWADDWIITITENGNVLDVKRVDAYDPLHVIHFNMARMNTNSTSLTFPTDPNSHMFEATASSYNSTLTISVTDSFGQVFSEQMQRPRLLYDMSREDKW